MRPGLSTVLAFVLFAVGLYFLTGCGPEVMPVCRHKAAFAALTYGEQFPVRIAIGPSDRSENYHAQAQAYIEGQWVWLETGNTLITTGSQDTFNPIRYFTFDEYLKQVFVNPAERR